MASLKTYRAKRDFTKTAEPSGGARLARRKEAGGRFVIHKHDARRLHYDLRLEHDGVLWSWAVTRGPSLDPSEKRLAVHVEDHPLDYGSFEGVIPKGEYGAGSVIVWDEGEWVPEGDPAAAMKKGHIGFELKGAKLNGAWHLVRLKPRRGEKRDNWLLIKSEDRFARVDGDVLDESPQSVRSGRTVEDVADGKPAKGDSPAKASAGGPKASAKRGAVRGAAAKTGKGFPAFVEPQLATLQAAPPSGEEWVHEVKFDGYRIQAAIADGTVRLRTRTGLDWTDRFGEAVRTALGGLDCQSAVLDGELVVLGEHGLASFSALQQDLSAGRSDRMIFYAFDLLSIDGADLRGEPLADRKERLSALLENADGPLRYSEHFEEPGRTMLRHACRMGLEGVVSKRRDSPYRSGRGKDWIKSKCTNRQEFAILGYVPSSKTRRGLRSLLVGYNEKGRLRYGGRVGTGFSQRVADDLRKRLDALKVDEPPLSPVPAGQKDAVWVEPKLVAEVEFRSWTSDGILRHASFQGLRDDKPADDIVQEVPETSGEPAQKRGKSNSRKGGSTVTLSNPEKLLWPEAGVSKRALLEYYERVWDRMEPFVVNRPLSLVRAPDGIDGQRFFQKHASKGMPDAVATMKDPQDGEELLAISSFDGLAALVQLGTVEVHIWGATIDAIETPDQVVFDLDPDEGLGVADVRAATQDVKDRLEELGLPSFLKTSGGKGFHVVVPLKPKADWSAVKGFAHDFAHAMAEHAPERYTATLSKKARAGRIFIDYLRNGRGSTTVAPYSARAKSGATVSMPATWNALPKLSPGAFAIPDASVAKALKTADPWKDFFKAGKELNRKA